MFINETVPNKIVAWIANILYKEHYVAVPTKHQWMIDDKSKNIGYDWKVGKTWNRIYVEADRASFAAKNESPEEFIFEHYYDYTKIDDSATEEYNIHHKRWDLNRVNRYEIKCDFAATYGPEFGFLTNKKPDSIFLAESSGVSVKWKRQRF